MVTCLYVRPRGHVAEQQDKIDAHMALHFHTPQKPFVASRCKFLWDALKVFRFSMKMKLWASPIIVIIYWSVAGNYILLQPHREPTKNYAAVGGSFKLYT